MNDEIGESLEAVPSQRPRSPRVPVNFPVELAGQTTEGESLLVRAEAVLVSRSGATLITNASLAPGATVRLTPPFGHALEAVVNGIWIDETDGQQRVGIKLLDPDGWFAE